MEFAKTVAGLTQNLRGLMIEPDDDDWDELGICHVCIHRVRKHYIWWAPDVITKRIEPQVLCEHCNNSTCP